MRSEEEELRIPDHTEMARELTGTGNKAQRPRLSVQGNGSSGNNSNSNNNSSDNNSNHSSRRSKWCVREYRSIICCMPKGICQVSESGRCVTVCGCGYWCLWVWVGVCDCVWGGGGGGVLVCVGG